MESDPIKEVENLTKEVHDLIEERGRSVFARYPLTFSFLATFGIAAVVYGFEKTMDKISFLRENPILMLVIGVFLLLFSGALYKRLQKE